MGRRRGLTPEAVVAAAVEIADRQGLEEVTLKEVADRLKVRSPSLYAHLDGLPDLRRRIALLGAATLKGELEEAARKRSGVDALEAIAHRYRAFAGARPGLYEAVQRAVVPGEDDELYEALASAVEPVFQALGESGVRRSDFVHLARAFRSALHGFVTLEQRGGFGMPEGVDESFRRMVHLLLEAIRGVGIGDRPGVVD